MRMVLDNNRTTILCLIFSYLFKYIQCSEAFQQVSSSKSLPKYKPFVHSRFDAQATSTMILAHNKETHSFARLSKHLHRFHGFIDPTVFGGLLAGGLHAVTGPDHLAAIIPNSFGKTGWYGAQLGALWGLGHGISASILGFTAFFVKGKISGKFHYFDKLSSAAEIAVGLSLIGIGLLGIKESQEIEDVHAIEETEKDAKGNNAKALTTLRAVFVNGLLHGFSWDGAPSLAPAIAMASWRATGMFLGAYSLGTVLAMSVSSGVVSALSTKIGAISNRPDLPKKLSIFSSMLAVMIGFYWLLQALFFK